MSNSIRTKLIDLLGPELEKEYYKEHFEYCLQNNIPTDWNDPIFKNRYLAYGMRLVANLEYKCDDFIKKKDIELVNKHNYIKHDIIMHKVKYDPNIKCIKCGEAKIKLSTIQSRSADEGPTFIRRCDNCGHESREN